MSWNIERQVDGTIWIIDEDKIIASISDADPMTIRLIAATPDLLEALREITVHFAGVMGGPLIAGRGVEFENGVLGIPTIAKARAAIAKAEAK